ncbi:MAG: M1 family metallopeptidase [Verrucomicrobiota bacterium]|nr:M1 family metallopeptidase [Verrucomicrobiota bacterium]
MNRFLPASRESDAEGAEALFSGRMLSSRLVGCLVISFLGVAGLKAETPFEFATAPGKLPKAVVPREYAVRIAPEMAKLSFAGSETIRLEVHAPVRELVLNALELEIASAAVDGKAVPASAIKLDPKEETLTIALASELAEGAHTLALTFRGKINRQGQGLYEAPYQELGTGAKKVMLGTQFEPADARRLFPCWDEPSFRARFQLTAVVPEAWTAVSNMPVEEEIKMAGGKEVRFGMTPPMASYLNVLCAGEFDAIEKRSGEVLHRVVATKGKAEMGRYALESAAQIVDFYNGYFGTAYPLPKLDEIAVPGGFGGAMENWGGITYFETGLLFDPANSSTETKQGIYQVIAHEVAHQWFGDLVTMGWWDDLWLNEGFASWMGSKCSAKFNPDWEVWLQRSQPRDPTRRAGIPKEAAMEGDARSTTHPIQQAIATVAEANGAFDDITYKKGQSFIRMLEVFLGDETFRDGIRHYTAAHKFSNTTTADLWDALGKASGKPVADIAANWTEQPGFPIVLVSRGADGKVTLTQERFTVNFPNPPALQWKIPLTYAVAGASAPVSVLMDEKTLELADAPANAAVKLNVDGAGNYRVQYDDVSWKLLTAELPRMSVPDRVNLLSDAWALVQANRAPLTLYFDLAEKLPNHTELAEEEQIITVCEFINRLMIGDAHREKFQQYARTLLRPGFDALGWTAKTGEPARHATLRASLIVALGNLGDAEVIAGCRERCANFLAKPESLSPDLRAPVLQVTGRYADEATWKKLHEAGLKTISIEQKQNYYAALTATTDPKLAKQALAIALTDELPTSRALHVVSRVARDSDHPELAWEFAKANMKPLLAKADALGVNSYAPSLFTFFSESARVSELQNYAKANLPPAAAPAVAKALDEVTFRAEFRKRLSQQLESLSATPRPPG